jgi:nucleotide-binding universal stress UspA family protein
VKKEVKMKILVAYDGSDMAKNALALALEHAKAFDAKIYVLHSLVTDFPRKKHEQDERDMEEVKGLLEKSGVPFETHLSVRNMMPGEHLVEFAEENDIDEIIVGVRRRSKVGKLLLSSTAQHVILNAACPVVSVK